jgi:hypothetical protein
MIKSKEKKNGILIYHLEKVISDDKLEFYKNKKISPKMISLILNEECDVYGENNVLLMKFRKNKLSEKNCNLFYDNTIQFATNSKSSNRITASGNKGKILGKGKTIGSTQKTMTNIIGYFDRFGPSQNFLLSKTKKKFPLSIRETYFTKSQPQKYANTHPLIEEINLQYKKLVPSHYQKQHAVSSQTPFHISNTVFSTVTINVNFQTQIHKDKGDYQEGFGNITVISKGEYKGGETCFPQYGVGVNVRTGDILFMDVHQYHGNLPIVKEKPTDIRMSIVCYLRENIWKKSKGMTKKKMKAHLNMLNQLLTKKK